MRYKIYLNITCSNRGYSKKKIGEGLYYHEIYSM